MKIRVTDRQGETLELDALSGWRVMEIIRDAGLDLKAECGGACACATCHVYIDPAFIKKLHPARADELEKLDEAFEVRDNSRLSCQILMSGDLDGLHVTLAPGTEK